MSRRNPDGALRAKYRKRPRGINWSSAKRAAVRVRLLEAQAGRCARCGVEFEADDVLELDHIEPFRDCGESREENMQLMHRKCNREKGSRREE